MSKLDRYLRRGNLDLVNACYPVDLPKATETAEFGAFDPHYMLYHFATWLAGNEVNKFTLVAPVSEMLGNAVNVSALRKIAMFGDEEDRDSFLNWRDKIAKWYVRAPMQDTYLPELPLDSQLNLTLVAHEKREIPFSFDEVFRPWSWITHNCSQGKVWTVNGGFAFESQEDAVKFKLAFE